MLDPLVNKKIMGAVLPKKNAAAIVRWGRDAAVQILLATDRDVEAALEVLGR